MSSIVLVPMQAGGVGPASSSSLTQDGEPNEKLREAARAALTIDYHASRKRDEDEESRRAPYGLCGRCTNFSFRVTLQDRKEECVHAECEAWRSPPFGAALLLDTRRRITNCSLFRVKNAAHPQLMFETATLLGPDVEAEKKKAEEKRKLREAPGGGYL